MDTINVKLKPAFLQEPLLPEQSSPARLPRTASDKLEYNAHRVPLVHILASVEGKGPVSYNPFLSEEIDDETDTIIAEDDEQAVPLNVEQQAVDIAYNFEKSPGVTGQAEKASSERYLLPIHAAQTAAKMVLFPEMTFKIAGLGIIKVCHLACLSQNL